MSLIRGRQAQPTTIGQMHMDKADAWAWQKVVRKLKHTKH
jgi:hypothetical protein